MPNAKTLLAGRLAGSAMELRDFRYLWAGQAVSAVGDQLFNVAVSLRVIECGGDAGDVGLVIGARMLATVLFVLIGGVWADRVPRRRAMMLADGFRLAAITVVVLGAFDTATVSLAVLTFLVGSGEAFFRPAYGGLVPSLVPEDRLLSANVWRGGMESAAAVVGPALGGVLVATVGTRVAFAANAATFAISLLCVLAVTEPPMRGQASRSSMVQEIREGLAAVRRVRWTAAILTMTAIQTMLVVAPHMVLLPVITQERFAGPSAYGLVIAMFSLSGFIGTIVVGRIRLKHPGTSAMVFNALFTLVPLVLLTPFSLWWVVAGYMIAGFAMMPFNTLLHTALQRQFPPSLLGRISSVDWLCSLALLPLGLAVIGPLADAVGRTTVLVVAAVVQLGAALLVLAVPGVRDFHQEEHEEQPVLGDVEV
ncbi:MFS transporter [Streptomyces sp. NEAU-sy36]|uniref:MFS transporter n=1 Tax=unclassified Streptomyces TaxID=2593676 RepID=UPI0015D59F54|nr:MULTISPECIES: MFS transporter [unclassified Streptomyces]QLJ03465.1 MFS transporter [Streptomyces sp. NEAU-sy36]